MEPGETPPQALQRELHEELSVTVSIGREVKHPSLDLWPASCGYSMRLFWSEVNPREDVKLTGSHDEFRWLGARELESVEWLTSDIAVLPLLLTALS